LLARCSLFANPAHTVAVAVHPQRRCSNRCLDYITKKTLCQPKYSLDNLADWTYNIGLLTLKERRNAKPIKDQ
jgi:hypothetical protein